MGHFICLICNESTPFGYEKNVMYSSIFDFRSIKRDICDAGELVCPTCMLVFEESSKSRKNLIPKYKKGSVLKINKQKSIYDFLKVGY